MNMANGLHVLGLICYRVSNHVILTRGKCIIYEFWFLPELLSVSAAVVRIRRNSDLSAIYYSIHTFRYCTLFIIPGFSCVDQMLISLMCKLIKFTCVIYSRR